MQISERETGPVVTYPSQEVQGVLSHFSKDRVSFDILVEEDQNYDSYKTTTLQRGCLWMCFVSLHFQIAPLQPGPSKSHFEKKIEITAFYCLKCNTEALNIPLKYTYFHIYHFIHHKDIKSTIVELRVALTWQWKTEATNSPSWWALLEMLIGDKSVQA